MFVIKTKYYHVYKRQIPYCVHFTCNLLRLIALACPVLARILSHCCLENAFEKQLMSLLKIRFSASYSK